MTLVALRGLLNRKLRTALTAIAILLGVAMIAGTYVLTDTINDSFSTIFHQANRPIDAVLSGKQQVQSQFSLPPALPANLLQTVKDTPGVAEAEGEIADLAQLIGPDGKPLSTAGGAPTFLFSRPSRHFQTLAVVKGREPSGNEILLDQDTVKRYHLHLGQTVGLVAAGPAQKFTIVGITKFGTVSSIGGATLISMELATAQRMAGKQGKYDQIVVSATSGVSRQELVRRLQARIPPGLRSSVKVQTSEQNAEDQTAQIGKALNFLTIALLAFAAIAVFVGAFTIFNTFSITVAQRAREFALLRTLGATRAQVLRSVILEALIIGVCSSIIGLFAGLGIARGLNSLFIAFGIDLPNAGMTVAPRTVIVSLLVGTVVTLVSASWPAIRATRVPPIAALREGAQLPGTRFARFTPVIAALVTLLGIALMIYGIFGSVSNTSQRLLLIGVGALALFVGVAMLSPQLVRPLAGFVGWPIERITAITGRLARENAMRNPSRTAVTAAALMIGLALVGFVTIFAAELRKTGNDLIDRQVAGNFAVYSDQNNFIPEGVGPALAKVSGVRAVSALKLDSARVAGVGTQANGIQPTTLRKLYRFDWKQGSQATLTGMGPHDVIIDDNFARDRKLGIGSRLRVTTPADRHDAFTVTGIYKNTLFLPNFCIRYDTFRKDWAQNRDRFVLVAAAPGQSLKVVRKRIDGVLKAQFPTATAHSQQELKDEQNKNVNQLLALIYLLLAMSVIVSLFGIINTLVLSIYERTREIGMLRAIGTTRTQVRWIIRWESVITAVIGAILGLLLGIVLAMLVTAGLQSQGIEYALPIEQLLIWVVFAVVFGIIAAAWPARRAARLDVLQALAYE